jgi:hypothetical protein
VRDHAENMGSGYPRGLGCICSLDGGVLRCALVL